MSASTAGSRAAASGASDAAAPRPRTGRPAAGRPAAGRAGDEGQVEGCREDVAIAALPAGAGAHETVQLLVAALAAVGGLPGEGQERAALALRLDQLLDPGGAEGADQLVLQVRDADEVGPDPVQAAAEIALLPLVAQAGQPDAEAARAEQGHEVPDVGRAAHRDHEDAFAAQVTAGPFGQSLYRSLVAHPLHQHHR